MPNHPQEEEIEMPSRRKKILELASQSQKLRDGELELDDNAKVSEGDDNGAYVQVWMWVPFDGTPLDKDSNE
jgi:hypothetical protein